LVPIPAPVQKIRPGSGLALTNQNLPCKAGACPTLSTTYIVQYSKRFPFIQAFSNDRLSNSKTAYHQCGATFLHQGQQGRKILSHNQETAAIAFIQ